MRVSEGIPQPKHVVGAAQPTKAQAFLLLTSTSQATLPELLGLTD